MSEGIERARPAGPGRSSRREFLREATAGVVGAAALAGGATAVSAAGNRLGEITLDALLLTYLGAPTGEGVAATYRLGRAYDTTFRLAATAAPDLRLRPSVPTGKERFFAGLPFEQDESSRVAGAITFAQRHHPGESESFGSTAPGSTENTIFLALYRPHLQLLGSPERPRYRFVPGPVEENGTSFLITNARQLHTRPEDFPIAQSTIDSFLAQYVTDPTALAAPRYSFVGSKQPPFTIREEAGTEPSERVTSAASASIVAASGFESAGSLAEVFAVGNTLDVTYFSSQEDRSGTLLTLETSADGPAPLQDLYWDSVFRTYALLARD